MMNKQHLYKTRRLPLWNYGAEGIYFITICTKDRRHFLGEIKNKRMHYSVAGAFAFTYMMEMCNDSFVTLEKGIVMPNHVHLLLRLDQEALKSNASAKQQAIYGQLKPLDSGSIPSVVNRYKSIVSRIVRENGCVDFKWQSRYHDRIVRNENEYHRIYNYIENNILNWTEDCFYL